jgi:hypothetical protein
MKIENALSRRTALQSLGAACIVRGATAAFASTPEEQCQSSSARAAWVAESLKRMLSIKPGMRRNQLSRVFTMEGGLQFSPLQRTFVSRDCPFFKVDVTFRRASDRDAKTESVEELDGDLITTVSRPYLQFTIAD